MCRQFLPISIATIELLPHYHRHHRPHHHYLTLPPIKDWKKNELRAHATRTWLIIPFWSTSVLITMSNCKISVFVICKISVFVGLEKY